jgi:predicted permease
MRREFEFHIELRATELARGGLAPDEALRRARADFGGMHNFAELGRAARGLGWLDALRFSWLDFKLGARMIVKYPGLTVMATLAIGIGIAIGAGVSGAIATIKSADLPLDEGDRVVAIQMVDVASHRYEQRVLRDFVDWRNSVRTIVDLGAFAPAVLNLVAPDGRGDAIRGAEMTASGFRVARVPPLLGRYLVDDDELASAEPVVVLGYDVWRNRFDGDSNVVGRGIRVGSTTRRVVGVMPRDFAFPINYEMWIPLRLNPLRPERRTGPSLIVFGRLAPGVTINEARSELATLSAVAARDYPATHRNLRARVLSFSQSWFSLDDPDTALALRGVTILVILLVLVICANVATLVYARTATRQSEIAVRSALGATRGRIIAQFFGEAFVLACCGAALGVLLITVVATRLQAALQHFVATAAAVPFWIRFSVSGSTLAYVVGLTVLGAVVIGVLPALRLTGARVQRDLQQLAGGHSTTRMSGMWTALILMQVAFAVALLPSAVRFVGEWLYVVGAGPGFAAEQYLSMTLATETRLAGGPGASRAEFVARFSRAREELMARLESEPDVIDVAYAASLPGSEGASSVEVEDQVVAAAQAATAQREARPRAHARIAGVDRRYFELFHVPVVAGRGFTPSDLDSAATTVVVNRAFVDTVLHGTNALGRRVRSYSYDTTGHAVAGPWSEIVGVVDDFPSELPFPGVPHAALYRGARMESAYPVTLFVHLRNDPESFVPRLRRVAESVDPQLLLRQVAPLGDRLDAQHLPLQWLAISLALVTLSVLMLSCAGVYALMAVVVTQRRREIGIRVALGADPRHVLWTLFSRASVQVGTGVAVGIVLATLADSVLADGELLGGHRFLILAAVSVFMAGFGLLAALTPARTALSVPPTEALKAE